MFNRHPRKAVTFDMDRADTIEANWVETRLKMKKMEKTWMKYSEGWWKFGTAVISMPKRILLLHSKNRSSSTTTSITLWRYFIVYCMHGQTSLFFSCNYIYRVIQLAAVSCWRIWPILIEWGGKWTAPGKAPIRSLTRVGTSCSLGAVQYWRSVTMGYC